MTTDEQRITRLEQAFVTITELFQNMDSRLDRHEAGIDELHAAQANSEAKIAALADAQIRTEEALTRLADAQIRTEDALVRMEAAIGRNTEDISQLSEIVRQLATKQNGNGSASG